METKNSTALRTKFNNFLALQETIDNVFCSKKKKLNGIFLTNNSTVIDQVLEIIPINIEIFNKKFLEPSCGQGVFLLKLIVKAYIISPKEANIYNFIQNNLYFIDIDISMIDTTKKNILDLYFFLYKKKFTGKFNYFISDFTQFEKCDNNLNALYENMDFIIGNPPYVTLYGRRDKKKNEQQRVFYLQKYAQFPETLKNGKINYVMLFIEHGLQFLKTGGSLSFIVDISFFETAYKYCRQYLVENFTIKSLMYNIQGFDNVASGQVILVVSKTNPHDNSVLVTNAESGAKSYIKQNLWNSPDDEFKFRISHCVKSEKILEKIFNKQDPTLKDLYPKKNLRTCVMLLNMEDEFTNMEMSPNVISYPYYRGSNGLKYKYSSLNHIKYFNYDKALQDNINNKLKIELTLKGIKNKKRIGLGETQIYDNPKVFIRQSAKELIASYDEKPSSANNSLYVFSLRNNSPESILFLKYLCGLLNSSLYTFFAQERRIVRYNKGKQPQIKISDLYQIFIPQDATLSKNISNLVNKIYSDSVHTSKHIKKIDEHIFNYYNLDNKEITTIKNSIESFLQ